VFGSQSSVPRSMDMLSSSRTIFRCSRHSAPTLACSPFPAAVPAPEAESFTSSPIAMWLEPTHSRNGLWKTRRGADRSTLNVGPDPEACGSSVLEASQLGIAMVG